MSASSPRGGSSGTGEGDLAGHVFISYSRSDRSYVERLVAYLTAEGFDVWMDNQISNGERWDVSLRRQIDACGAFVLVMSPEAEDSHWVGEEVTRASVAARIRMGMAYIPEDRHREGLGHDPSQPGHHAASVHPEGDGGTRGLDRPASLGCL